MLTCRSLIGRIARITAPSVNGITATLNEISVFVVTDSKIGSLLLPKSCWKTASPGGTAAVTEPRGSTVPSTK